MLGNKLNVDRVCTKCDEAINRQLDPIQQKMKTVHTSPIRTLLREQINH